MPETPGISVINCLLRKNYVPEINDLDIFGCQFRFQNPVFFHKKCILKMKFISSAVGIAVVEQLPGPAWEIPISANTRAMSATLRRPSQLVSHSRKMAWTCSLCFETNPKNPAFRPIFVFSHNWKQKFPRTIIEEQGMKNRWNLKYVTYCKVLASNKNYNIRTIGIQWSHCHAIIRVVEHDFITSTFTGSTLLVSPRSHYDEC